MLWYKSWLETRWRFLIGFGMLLCSAAAAVFTYPRILELMPMVPANVGGELGERIRDAAELARSYRGYVWSQWFRQNLSEMATLFAVLLGTASLLSTSNGALFTLSLPVSRHRLFGVRAATGLAELFVLVFVPSLLISILAPAIGQSYSVGSALVHSACLFIVASIFFHLALLLSTLFSDTWRPMLIAIAIAVALMALHFVLRSPAFSVFRVMSGESFFRDGRVPWAGLIASAVISALLYRTAALNYARRDF